MPQLNLSNGTSTTSPGYVLNARRFGLIHGNNQANGPANKIAFQAWFDALAATAAQGGGARGVIPPGYYWTDGGITIPNTSNPITVEAAGARIRMSQNQANTAMFRTTLPSGLAEAEAFNDVRDDWEWHGGWLQGFTPAVFTNQVGMELNCVSRMRLSKVKFSNFSTCLRGRFVLHLHVDSCRFYQFTDYGVRVEEQSDWPQGDPANAASNALIINNTTRFLPLDGALAAIRIAHSHHTIDDVTIEGGHPVVGIEYVNANTSSLISEATRLHIECDPTEATVKVDATHGYHVDFRFHVNNPGVPRIKVVSADTMYVGRIGFHSTSPTVVLETPAVVGGSNNCKWHFDAPGWAGAQSFDPTNPAWWVGGVVPASISGVGLAVAGTNNAALALNTNRLTAPSATGKLMIGTTVVGTQT